MPLNKRFCETVAVPGRYQDGRRDGLFLQVSKPGAKHWCQRITIKGRRRDLGLGSYRFVSLAEARDAAYENQKIARRGGDPRAGVREAPAFAEAVERVVALHAPTWRDKGEAVAWRRVVRDHAGRLAHLPVDAIEAADVLAVLAPLWSTKRRTGQRLKGVIGRTLKWAVAQGFRTDDPMPAAVAALPRNTGAAVHHRAAAHAVLGEALVTLREVDGWTPVLLALEFIALTAARSGEVRGATWAEVDMAAATWTVPAERMKGGKAHRVPLSGRALEVLEAARLFADADGRIFPSSRGGQLPANALRRLVEKAGLQKTFGVHGLRSSFRDWCAETGRPRELAEAALAHAVAGVEGAYFRSDLFDRRRALMEAWASYLGGTERKVVVLRP